MVEKLLRGHGQFHGDSTDEERRFLGRLASEGQSPGALYVGCSDSRVVPEILTASGPGDLFVVRNVANLVPPYGHASINVGAALEYGVAVLEVPHIIVCGHYGCGGVEAAFGGLEGVQHLENLSEWLRDVFPAMDRAREDVADEPELSRDQILRRGVEHNTIAQVANLWSYPVVRAAIEQQKLHLHAWIYDLHSLGLRVFDAESQSFVASAAMLPLLRSSCLHSGVLDARMMDFPLTISHLLGRARALFSDVEVVSRLPDKRLQRSTYGSSVERCERLARALQRLGVKQGDAVATLGWNHRQHLECYLGVPSMGAVVHTLNIRLHPDEIAYIANHAEDKVVVVDGCLLPLFEKFRAKLTTVKHVIVVRDEGDSTAVPAGDLDYETLLAAEPVAPAPGGFAFAADAPFPALDERSAAMICYTSGTTGNPKGVVYSHRSTVLHALAISLKDSVGIGSDDVVLPVVPMFHASAWGTPFASISSGAKLVFPGPHLDPTSLLDLMAQEKVTVAAGVPTIWLGILQLLDQHPGRWDLSSVRTMLIGGAAAPPSLIEGFEKRHGLEVTHAWGMTETNPLGTLARVKPAVRKRGPEAVLSARASQGLPVPFVELRHVDDQGAALPWDGAAMGELEVRGPWVSSSYLGDEGKDRFTADGWFRTGDVVTIDADGYVRITDRSKDVVKSGGEWISSVALENALMAHPAVLEAAVFAGRHAKWDERPIAAVVLKPGAQVTDEQLTAHLAPTFAKFWLPDAYVYIEQIPRTSTGKFLKTKLRELYGDLLVKASTP